MKSILFSIMLLLGFSFLEAQSTAKNNREKEKEDSIKMAKLEAKMVYPFINAGLWSGIFPVSNPTEIPDPNINYKLLFELTANNKDSAIKEINMGITEICRIINLHVASGIPASHIIPVVVVHGHALFALLSNENFKKKYKIDNPNIPIIEELIQKTGARFIACGQAMNFFEIQKENLLPQVYVSLTAQTALSSYRLKGYQQMEVRIEK